MTNVLAVIFAKYPTPGLVKTRMVPPLTTQNAAALHTACVMVVCDKVSAIPNLDWMLAVSPDERLLDMATLMKIPAARCQPQGEGDLGVRMARTVDQVFASELQGVLLLGADSPTLPSTILTQAVEEICAGKTVLGPCHDGGYYALGLARPIPELFQDIDWGTSNVASQTRQRAETIGEPLIELPLWYDLDRFDDLPRAREDLDRIDTPPTPAEEALIAQLKALSHMEQNHG